MAIRTILYEFSMGDVEDPEIYAAEPLWQWQQSDAGKWCMKNCLPDSVTWGLSADMLNWGHRVTVYGDLAEHDHTYFRLKYHDYTKRT